MNSENDIATEATKEFIKVVAPKAYDDLAKPALSAIGQLIAHPFEMMSLRTQYAREKLQKELAYKLQNFNPAQLHEPPLRIAYKAIEGAVLCEENETLYDMYTNLLAKAMTQEDRDKAHPAYAEILGQISADEALLLKNGGYLLQRMPLLFVMMQEKGKAKKEVLFGREHLMCDKLKASGVFFFNYIPQTEGVNGTSESRACAIDNFARLGIIDVDEDRTLEDVNLYRKIYESYYASDIFALGQKYKDQKDICLLNTRTSPTALGRGFHSACCVPPSPGAQNR